MFHPFGSVAKSIPDDEPDGFPITTTRRITRTSSDQCQLGATKHRERGPAPYRPARLPKPSQSDTFADEIGEAHDLEKVSRWVFWILSRHSSGSLASAANSGQRFTAA